MSQEVSERKFGEWAMLHDPAVTWIWTQSEVSDGAAVRATPEEITGFFLPLSVGSSAT